MMTYSIERMIGYEKNHYNTNSTFLFIGLTNLTFNKNMEKEKLKTINKEYEKDNT